MNSSESILFFLATVGVIAPTFNFTDLLWRNSPYKDIYENPSGLSAGITNHNSVLWRISIEGGEAILLFWGLSIFSVFLSPFLYVTSYSHGLTAVIHPFIYVGTGILTFLVVANLIPYKGTLIFSIAAFLLVFILSFILGIINDSPVQENVKTHNSTLILTICVFVYFIHMLIFAITAFLIKPIIDDYPELNMNGIK